MRLDDLFLFEYVKALPQKITEDEDYEQRTPAVAEFYKWFRRSKEQNDIRVHFTQENTKTPLWLASIRSVKPSGGAATRVMNKACEIADKYGLPIKLVMDETSQSANWLEGWYTRLGFELTGRTEDYGAEMIRHPR